VGIGEIMDIDGLGEQTMFFIAVVFFLILIIALFKWDLNIIQNNTTVCIGNIKGVTC
jgi:hypothetical protein